MTMIDLTCYECDPPKHFDKPAAANGHRRWTHPTPLEDEGEECEPPPPRQGVTRQWTERLALLESHPGVWRRWPYTARSPAYRSARRINDQLLELRLPIPFRIEAHHVDDHWWVYGMRVNEEPTA